MNCVTIIIIQYFYFAKMGGGGWMVREVDNDSDLAKCFPNRMFLSRFSY